ncbi:MAG: D-2-hydroxyacid dehydrogenase [Desulfobacterales bacterium]|nr:D-2-hydroxyacid dehydrogenase [Desulfobacterales bacterium]
MTLAVLNFDLPDPLLARLRQNFPQLSIQRCADKESLFEHLPRAEILMTFMQCTTKMLDAAPGLKWIQAISAGVDFLPLEEIRRRGILLTCGRGTSTIQMAEYAMAAMINLARNFHVMFRNQVQGKWERGVPQQEIYGATVGILGLGAIGAEIARRAAVMGMRVLGVRRSPAPMEGVAEAWGSDRMADVFRQSDYVINLLPATAETRRIIDQKYFDLMKPTACFISMGRGATVNEPDLIAALRQKKIRGLVSDVYAVEPLPADSPLWALENVILTPHVCGASPQYMARAMEIIEHNLDVYTSGQGEMMHRVDMTKGY